MKGGVAFHFDSSYLDSAWHCFDFSLTVLDTWATVRLLFWLELVGDKHMDSNSAC